MAADDETQRQLHELRDELAARRTIRLATRRRLDALEEQAATLGIQAPPQIATEIADLNIKRRELDATCNEIEKRIARLELAPTPAVEVLPRTPGSTPLPQLIPAVIDSRMQAIERGQDRDTLLLGQLLARLDAADQARIEGQRDYRFLFAGIVVALTILAIGIVLIAIRVY